MTDGLDWGSGIAVIALPLLLPAREFALMLALAERPGTIQSRAQLEDRLYTWGLVGWPDVKHVDGLDFSEVINKALELPSLPENPGQEILTGFGHNAVLGVADKVVAAVKSGAIKHFFLIGGCDGAEPGRAISVPNTKAISPPCGAPARIRSRIAV